MRSPSAWGESRSASHVGPWVALYRALLAATLPITSLAPRFHDKARRRARDESTAAESAARRLETLREDGREVVVFHAASAGEFEQLKPVLTRLDRSRWIVVQTFFSPTIYEKERDCPLFDVSCYLPLDYAGRARAFFAWTRPTHFVVNRHDVWPNHVIEAHRLGIRTAVINANLHERSLRLHPLARAAGRALTRHIDLLLVPSERVATHWRALASPQKIEVVGDSRFDRVLERSREISPQATLPSGFADGKSLVVFGSVHASDEDAIFGALAKLRESGKHRSQRYLYVPHEPTPEALARAEDRFSALDLPSARFTTPSAYDGEPVILGDVVGILADLYRHGDRAYVGGGFDAGGHSVTEPAVHGCAVAFGPHVEMLDEAVEMQRLGVAKTVRDVDDMLEFLQLPEEPRALARARQEAQEYVRDRTGASDRIIERLFGPSHPASTGSPCSAGSSTWAV